MDFWRRRSLRVLLRSQLAPAPGGGIGGPRPDEGGKVGAVENNTSSVAVSILSEASKTGDGERGPLVVGRPGDNRVGSGEVSRAAGAGWGGRAGRGVGVIRDSMWSFTSRWREWARDSKRLIILDSKRSEMRSKSWSQSGVWVV